MTAPTPPTSGQPLPSAAAPAAETTPPSRPPGEPADHHEAIQQIERRRHFQDRAVMSALGLLLVTMIWAVTEYNNAGGWPTSGFSQSSGTQHEWNLWIIYPAIGWLGLTTAGALLLHRRRPITKQDIERELRRQPK